MITTNEMKILADMSTVGVWIMSAFNTLFNFDVTELSSVIQLIMAVLGVIYLIVRIYNAILNDKLDRQLKEIDRQVGQRGLDEEEEKENEQI